VAYYFDCDLGNCFMHIRLRDWKIKFLLCTQIHEQHIHIHYLYIYTNFRTNTCLATQNHYTYCSGDISVSRESEFATLLPGSEARIEYTYYIYYNLYYNRKYVITDGGIIKSKKGRIAMRSTYYVRRIHK
jgi:hypothetical protein